uniref:Uncharacterized protein n=1 Tax=Heterorhabditis bacteriophora TaxID=37862 RepID=A0A1I7WNU4_HETBA
MRSRAADQPSFSKSAIDSRNNEHCPPPPWQSLRPVAHFKTLTSEL